MATPTPIASDRAAEDAARDALCRAGQVLAARGWVPATSGNLSCRIDAGRIAVTASGRDKGALTRDDILILPLDVPPPADASAETPLHLARYRADPAIGAVLHVHSVAATLASRNAEAAGEIVFEGYEMLKALDGITTHDVTVALPVFANDQDTAALAERVEARLKPGPGQVGYLLAGHGLYGWGRHIDDAMRHIEALDFLLTCEMERERLTR